MEVLRYCPFSFLILLHIVEHEIGRFMLATNSSQLRFLDKRRRRLACARVFLKWIRFVSLLFLERVLSAFLSCKIACLRSGFHHGTVCLALYGEDL